MEHTEKKEKIGKWILGISLLFFLAMMNYINPDSKNWQEYEEELTEATSFYWQEENGKISKRSCENVEEKLKKMQRDFAGNMEQRKILLLLAVNAEYMEKYENAYFYYEQLLMYEEDYDEGYVEYGLFLIRQGKKEESERLYEVYQKKEKQGEIAGKKSRNFTIWMERLDDADN